MSGNGVGRRDILKLGMVSAMAAFGQSCGFARQHQWMSHTSQEDAEIARKRLRDFFTDMYDASFYAKRLDKRGLPETETGRISLPMVLWRDPGVPLPSSGLVIISNDVHAEQMRQVREIARDVRSYYEFLNTHRDEDIYGKEIKEIGPEIFKKGLTLDERFMEVFHQAVAAGIVKIPEGSEPSVKF